MTEQHWTMQRSTIHWPKDSALSWPRLGPVDCSRQVALAFLIALAMTGMGVLAWLFPLHPTLPLASLAALVLATAIAMVAWRVGARRAGARLTLWDTAGALALIGFGAGMLADPESVVQLFLGEQSRKSPGL